MCVKSIIISSIQRPVDWHWLISGGLETWQLVWRLRLIVRYLYEVRGVKGEMFTCSLGCRVSCRGRWCADSRPRQGGVARCTDGRESRRGPAVASKTGAAVGRTPRERAADTVPGREGPVMTTILSPSSSLTRPWRSTLTRQEWAVMNLARYEDMIVEAVVSLL